MPPALLRLAAEREELDWNVVGTLNVTLLLLLVPPLAEPVLGTALCPPPPLPQPLTSAIAATIAVTRIALRLKNALAIKDPHPQAERRPAPYPNRPMWRPLPCL